MKKVKRRAATGWGAPQSHRFLWQVIRDASSLRGEEQVQALRRSPRCVRELLRFCYGNHAIDLPITSIDYDPIPISAYSEAPELGDEDVVAREKFTRLFAVGVHPTLTSERRLSLWKDIMERASREERELLDTIRTERVVPGITHAAVAEAFGSGFLDEPPAPDAPVEGISYYDERSIPDDYAPQVQEPGAPAPARVPTAQELHYQNLMRRMGW